MKKISTILSLILLLQPLLVIADEIVKKNGEVIEGKIEKIEQIKYYRIRIKDDKLLQIKWEDVESVSFGGEPKLGKELFKETKLNLYEQYKMREISPWGGFAVSLFIGLGVGHYVVGSTISGVIFTGVELLEVIIAVSDRQFYSAGISLLFLTRLAEIISIFPVVNAKNEAIKKELGITFKPELQFNKDKINLTLLSYKF